MILRCLLSQGVLDISSQETYQGNFPETIPFRISMTPGQTIEVQDEYRNLANIKSAISAGLLEVVSYDSSDGSVTVNAEDDGLSTLKFNAVSVESPDGVNKTFTLPGSEVYVTTQIRPFINGQALSPDDFTEDVGRTSITLSVDVPAPISGDKITFQYVEES
jgi:hypothetical protein